MIRRTFLSVMVRCAAALCLFSTNALGAFGKGTKKVDKKNVVWDGIDKKSTVRGLVTCDGAGVEGVVVTDGYNMTRTNSNGAYGLRTSSKNSKFVYLTIPSGYEVPSNRGFLPDFYRKVGKTVADDVQQFDFELKKVNNDRHIIMLSADMHIMNNVKIQSRTETTPAICPDEGEKDADTLKKHYSVRFEEYLKTLPADVPVYGINLGDMTNDYTYWKRGADFENYIKIMEEAGLTVQTFHVIGNHDHDKRVMDIEGDDDSEAEMEYMAALGPTYYSFNLGKVHYVVLDNMKYVNTGGKINFNSHINQPQMDWFKLDAEFMSPDVARIVICEHVASYRNTPKLNAYVGVDNADEMLVVYAAKGVPITMLAGHHHVAQTIIVSGKGVDVVEYIHPAVTGAWWYFPLCADGSPTTFTEYDFDGGGLTKRRSFNFTYPEEQYYRVYNEGLTNEDGKPVIRMNIWDYSKRWKFACRENGKMVDSSKMKRTALVDPRYSDALKNTGNGIEDCSWLKVVKTYHAFEYAPDDPSADIQIKAWDEFGDELFTINTKVQG